MAVNIVRLTGKLKNAIEEEIRTSNQDREVAINTSIDTVRDLLDDYEEELQELEAEDEFDDEDDELDELEEIE